MEQLVIDANVVVKLFINERYSDAALKFKDGYIVGRFEVTVPSLMEYEFINTLKYKKFSKEETLAALNVVRNLGFDVEAPSTLFADLIIEFSYKYNLTSYDASYLALAYMLGINFYTADEKLIDSVKGLTFVKHIKDLGA